MKENGTVLLDTGTIRIKRARHGLMAYPVRDSFVGRSLDLYGEWSAGDADALAPFLRPGMTALDVGANLGSLTVFLAGAVGPGGRVVAFEPVAASHRLLQCNLALNDLAHVEARPVAVGRERGTARVPELDFTSAGNFGAAALGASGPSREVEMVPLDGLDLAALDVVKVDVEGHELDVVAGGARALARFRPVMLLENEEPSLSRALIEALLALDYRLWWHAPPLFRPDNPFGRAENVFPTLGSLNLLCLPVERPDAFGRTAGIAALRPVDGPDDWPAWWPDWDRRPRAVTA